MTLYRRLQALERRAGIERTSDAEYERRQRESQRQAYLRSPAGVDLEQRIVALIHQWLGAQYDEEMERKSLERPDLLRDTPLPCCGSRLAGPHICYHGRSSADNLAELEATYAEADRQTAAWLAEGGRK